MVFLYVFVPSPKKVSRIRKNLHLFWPSLDMYHLDLPSLSSNHQGPSLYINFEKHKGSKLIHLLDRPSRRHETISGIFQGGLKKERVFHGTFHQFKINISKILWIVQCCLPWGVTQEGPSETFSDPFRPKQVLLEGSKDPTCQPRNLGWGDSPYHCCLVFCHLVVD